MRLLLLVIALFILGCSKHRENIDLGKPKEQVFRQGSIEAFFSAKANYLYPSLPAYALLPAQDHLLVGLGGGLFKYNHNSYVIIASVNDAITALANGSSGNLLIGTENKGLFLLDKNNNLRHDNRFPNGHVTTTLYDERDGLFVGYKGLGIYTVKDGQVFHSDIKENHVDAHITSIIKYSDMILIGTAYQGLWRWKGTKWVRFSKWGFERINSLSISSGRLAVCMQSGIYLIDREGNITARIDTKKEEPTSYLQPFIGTSHGFVYDRREFGSISSISYWGSRYFAASTNGLLVQRSGTWELLKPKNGIQIKNTSCISSIKDTILVAGMEGVSFIYKNGSIKHLTSIGGHNLLWCSAISGLDDGTMILGFLRGGWLICKGKSYQQITEAKYDSLPPSAESIRIIGDSAYLIDREHIYKYKDGRLELLLVSPIPLTDIALHNGKTYVGTYGRGLCLLENGNLLEAIHPANKINRCMYIKALLVDDKNTLWIGSWVDGLYRLEDEAPTKGGVSVTSLAIDKKGDLIIGTFKEGIFCLKEGRFFQFKDELLSPEISCVYDFKNGFTYSTYSNGVCYFRWQK